MNITSTIAGLVFGYLQTICPHDPGAMLEVETHLGLIQDNLRELQLKSIVHFCYPVLEVKDDTTHQKHGVSLVVAPQGDYCWNIPVYIYLTQKESFSEIPLQYGRFLPLTFAEYINPLVGEIMTRYNERTLR